MSNAVLLVYWGTAHLQGKGGGETPEGVLGWYGIGGCWGSYGGVGFKESLIAMF